MKNATINYASGWWIKFPAHTSAPRLFLEWFGEFQHTNKRRLTFAVRIDSDPDDVLNDVMCIYDIRHLLKTEAQECRDYINSNMG
jgi:hypothetical protein